MQEKAIADACHNYVVKGVCSELSLEALYISERLLTKYWLPPVLSYANKVQSLLTDTMSAFK